METPNYERDRALAIFAKGERLIAQCEAIAADESASWLERKHAEMDIGYIRMLLGRLSKLMVS